jgi:hypothetical protein
VFSNLISLLDAIVNSIIDESISKETNNKVAIINRIIMKNKDSFFEDELSQEIAFAA